MNKKFNFEILQVVRIASNSEHYKYMSKMRVTYKTLCEFYEDVMTSRSVDMFRIFREDKWLTRSIKKRSYMERAYIHEKIKNAFKYAKIGISYPHTRNTLPYIEELKSVFKD